MILIDSNVPMSLVGAQHPNKTRATQLVADLIRNGERLVTDIKCAPQDALSSERWGFDARLPIGWSLFGC